MKNLFDATLAPDTSANATVSNVVLGGFTVSSTVSSSTWQGVGFTKHLTPGAVYHLSFNVSGSPSAAVSVYNSAGNWIAGGQPRITVPDDGIVRITFYCNGSSTSGDYSATFSQIQLEAGANATPYEPYLFPAWSNPKTNWNTDDRINIVDWQRIDDNIWQIADFYGTQLPYKNWYHTNWPTPTEVSRIESNINALLKETHAFQSRFDFALLNDIETQLLNLHAKVQELQLSIRRSGTFVCGQQLYIPLGGVT